MEAKVVSEVRGVIRRARSRGMTDEEITKWFEAQGYSPDLFDPYQKACSLLNCLVFKVYPVIFLLALSAYPLFRMMAGYSCLVSEISPFGEAVNPMANCEMCEGVTGAPRLSNLSKDDFIRNYAYTSKPILVVGAVSNWTALDVFSYEYFKSLYVNSPESLEDDNSKGQFFSYSSNMGDLRDLFSLPSEVASMETEKWYIGW